MLVSLFFIIALLPLTAFAVIPQLSCTSADKDTQLAITPNALGSHDVSLHTQVRTRPALQTWLALRLSCTVRGAESKVWHCTAAQHNPLSSHAHSTLHSVWHESDSKELERGKELEISIASPLLPEGTASYRFAGEHCTTQTPTPRDTYTPAPHTCQAYFSGAYYHPDQGDCVEATLSGCRDPFPFRSRTECRAALKL